MSDALKEPCVPQESQLSKSIDLAMRCPIVTAPSLSWTQEDAVALCRAVEAICPEFGCHVALTGGSLYKHGMRQDCDILFYRIRQVEQIDVDGLFAKLRCIGFFQTSGFGWCYKATFMGKSVDCFFPESDDGECNPDGNE